MTAPAAATTTRDGDRVYLIPHPETGETMKLPNISSFLDVLHAFGLTDWKLVNAMVGVAMSKDLVAGIVAANYIEDPRERKRALKLYIDQAIDLGQRFDPAKGFLASDFGSAIHLLTEHADAKISLLNLPDVVNAHVAHYVDRMRGIEVVRSEFTVWGDGYAGTGDRVIRFVEGVETFGPAYDEFDLGRGCFVADIKTGSVYEKMAMQCAALVNARGVYVVDDLETGAGHHEALPDDLRRDVGFCLHVVEKAAKLIPFSLELAWPAFRGAIDVKAFDLSKPKGKALPKPAPVSVVETAPAPEQDGAAGTADEPAAPEHEGTAFDRAKHHIAEAGAVFVRRRALQERILALDLETKQAVRDNWPNVPGLKGEHVHTAEELDAIERAVAAAEAKTGAPFPEPSPLDDQIPNDDERVADVRRRLDALPRDLQERIRVEVFVNGKVPNLATGLVTLPHLLTVSEAVLAAEDKACARVEHVEALAQVVDDPDVFRAAIAATGQVPGDPWAMPELRALDNITDALGLDVFALGESGALEVVDREPIARGFDRDALIAAAKPLAIACGHPAPKALKDLYGDVVLCAALALR